MMKQICVYNAIVMLDMIISSEVEVYVLACKDIQTQNVSNMIYKAKWLYWWVGLIKALGSYICMAGNCTPGSWFNSLAWQAHPSESRPILLTPCEWVPGQTRTMTYTSYYVLMHRKLRWNEETSMACIRVFHIECVSLAHRHLFCSF